MCQCNQPCNCNEEQPMTSGVPASTIYIPVPGAKGDPGAKGEVGPTGPAGQNGTNGVDGTDGTGGTSAPPAVNQWVYKLTSTNVRPATPTSAWSTEGWYVDMMDTTTVNKYRWVSMRTLGATSVPNTFSTPVLDGIYATGGLPGEKGENGSYRDVIFRVNGSLTAAPALINNMANPTDWTRVFPSVSTGQYMWRSEVWKNGDGTLMLGNLWSAPYRMTAVDGAPGAPGQNGVDGRSVSILGSLASTANLPLTGNPGDGYIIGQNLWVWSATTSSWINAGEIKGPQGDPGASVVYQYSVSGNMSDGSAWHNSFVTGDLFMRLKLTSASTYDGPFRIVGEEGATGPGSPIAVFQYSMNTNPNSPPAQNDSSWQDAPPALAAYSYIWMRQGTRHPITNVITWNTPIRINGPEGKTAPILVWRDVFDISKEYQGTPQLVQAVSYGGTHYITRTDAPGTNGKFTGQIPGGSNNLYWNIFEVDVASIATGFLFVDSAFINNLTVNQLQTASAGKRITISRVNNNLVFVNSDNTSSLTIDSSDDNYGQIKMEWVNAGITYKAITNPGAFVFSKLVGGVTSGCSITPDELAFDGILTTKNVNAITGASGGYISGISYKLGVRLVGGVDGYLHIINGLIVGYSNA